MTTHDELFTADLLRSCDFSRDSAVHRSSLRKKLLARSVELADDERDMMAAADDPDSGPLSKEPNEREGSRPKK